MENPFELIMEKLNSIEKLVLQRNQPTSNVIRTEIKVHDIMNLAQVCEYISVSKSNIYKFTSSRTIPHFKTGKRIYFKRLEIDEWLTKNKIKTKAEIEREVDEELNKMKRRR
jgi:excisionase family DNA binding protein